MLHKQLREVNRLSWNEAIRIRNRYKGEEAVFFREGGNALDPEERALLGDLSGLSVVHLQCNCGEDTLSLAQLGATVTGVDISDTAIDTARLLAEAAGIPATFHRMDVYDWLEQAAQATARFDGVFCSYGSVIWLSDLTSWAKGIAGVLKPGGRFVLLELHPVLLMFEHDWTLKFPYSSEGNTLTFEEGMSAIVKHPDGHLEDFQAYTNPYPTYECSWGIGEVVMTLLEAGLTLTALNEYQYAYCDSGYERMRQTADGRWLPPQEVPDLPLRYGISTLKRGVHNKLAPVVTICDFLVAPLDGAGTCLQNHPSEADSREHESPEISHPAPEVDESFPQVSSASRRRSEKTSKTMTPKYNHGSSLG